MSTSTVKKGMSLEDYKRRQEQCDQEKHVVDTNKRLQNIELSLDRIQREIEKVSAEQGSLESSCESQLRDIMNSTMSSLKEFRQCVGDFESRLYSQDMKMQALSNEQYDLVNKEDLRISLKMIDSRFEQIEANHKKIHNEVHGLIDRLRLDFSNQLKAFKEEVLNRPTGLPELQKLLDAKIELVELNGQNAVLRSSNNEKQILLVERKIDHIYQLIKKIELSKQE